MLFTQGFRLQKPRSTQMIVISIIGWHVIDHDANISIGFDCGSMLVLISNSRLRRLVLNSVTQTVLFSLIFTYARNFRFQFQITANIFWYVGTFASEPGVQVYNTGVIK